MAINNCVVTDQISRNLDRIIEDIGNKDSEEFAP